MWHAAYGMPADLEYQAEGGGLEPASTCRVLHALLKQRQRDIDRGKEATERLSRMAHDLRMRDQQREKMLQKLAAKDRELGALENKASSPTVSSSHSLSHLIQSMTCGTRQHKLRVPLQQQAFKGCFERATTANKTQKPDICLSGSLSGTAQSLVMRNRLHGSTRGMEQR